MSTINDKTPNKRRKSAPLVDEIAALPNYYDSMAQAAKATGLPLIVIKEASRDNSGAFRHGRVYLAPLIRWIGKRMTDDNGDVGNWSDKLKEYQAKREKLRLAEDESKLVDRGEIKDGIGKCVAALLGELDRRFTAELPPALKGLDEMAIRNRCLSEISQLRKAMVERFEAIGDEETVEK